MTDLAFPLSEPTAASAVSPAAVRPLSAAAPGHYGVILRVGPDALPAGAQIDAEEAVDLERRLLELGFVEGATIELLHQGLIGADPIAVRVDDMRVALRRREARAIEVRFADPAAGKGLS